MDISKALTKVGKTNPEEADFIDKYLQDMNKSVVELGTNKAFALHDKDGEIKAFKQNLHLSKANGGLIQPVPAGPFVISAQGYEKWADEAGANAIFPKDVLVGNERKPNPFAERDPKNRRILAVHARAISFRFSSKGIPQVSDWTTIFDTPSYRMIDLLAKAKKLPQAFKLLPYEMTPVKAESATWAKYPFDESTNLWVNTSHDEALTWFSQILNREKKAMDFAQTFAKRNSLKHLSGLQKAPSSTWDIPILCWRPVSGNIVKWDASQYSDLQDRVNGIIEGGSSEFEGKKVELNKGAGRVSDEEGFAEIENQTDPEDQPKEEDHVEEETTPESGSLLKKQDAKNETVDIPHVTESGQSKQVSDKYFVMVQSFPAESKQAITDLELGGVDVLSGDDMQKIYNRVQEILNAE